MSAGILAEIVANTRAELAAAKARCPAAELAARAADLPPTRDFAAALRRPGEVRLIAEVKRASPSAGTIRADVDPAAIARAYADAGAAAISVLTDQRYFQGSPADLQAVAASVRLPILRKDFVIDAYQLLEARVWGADAVLLIVAVLSDGELADLHGRAAELGLAALVEVHTNDDAARAEAAGARLVGINNRDLTTFETDLETTLRMRPRLPDSMTIVSESGIRTPEDIDELREAPVDAVLVGESLMRQADVGAAARELVAAGRRRS